MEPFQYKIKIRPELRQRIGDAAEQRGVTLTREMVDRIERSFDHDGLAAEIRKLQRLIDKKVNAA